jgi:flagellar motility protein MotE (MotC chaperone)
VLKIFNKNIADGKIDEVFDIITKMKTKQVMNVLKKMDAKSATILMNRLTLSKGK